MLRILAVMIALTAIGAAEPADSARLPGEVRRTLERCDEAAGLEREAKWDEALAAYLRILDDAADDLIPDGPDARRLRPARVVIPERIASHSELRKRYRQRFETEAERQVNEALARHDFPALERVAAERRPCRAASRALEALGDVASERGDFAAARRRYLAAASAADAAIGLLRAKSILAGVRLGESMHGELEQLKRDFPAVTGHLAGRDGVLADILAELIRQPADLMVPLDMEQKSATTFAVDASRRGIVSAITPTSNSIVSYSPISLPHADADKAAARSRRFNYHPIVWQGHTLICDGSRIFAYSLATGILDHTFDLDRAQQAIGRPDRAETLTIDEGRVYARLTSSGGTSRLVRLERDPNSAEFRFRERWVLPATVVAGSDDGMAQFDGCPLVDDGRLYCSWTRTSGNRALVNITAFAADSPRNGPLWSRPVFEIPAKGESQRLLTLAGPNLVLGSDAGCIIAVNAVTGRPAWAFRYPSRRPHRLTGELLPTPRDLSPPIYADGRLFVAPVDTGEILALDAWTGAPLWQQATKLETVHLLGVIGRRLIVTADGLRRGIAAIDVATGQVDPEWGSLASQRPAGRGLIIKDQVLWPTKPAGIKLLRLDHRFAESPAELAKIPAGNLAYGEGHLLVATHDQLHVLKFDPSRKPAKETVASTRSSRRVEFARMDLKNPPRAPDPAQLESAWHKELPAAENPLAIYREDLLLSRGDALIARRLPKGDELWQAKIENNPRWVGGSGDNLLVAGSQEVAVLDAKNGSRLWNNRVSNRETLSTVSVAGGRVVARVGKHRLRAWDVHSGQQAWEFVSAIDEIAPEYYLDEHTILVQTTARIRLLDTQTGATRATLVGSRELWTATPVGLPNGLLVFAASSSRVLAIEPQTGKVAWSYNVPNSPEPDGSLPQPFFSDDSLWLRTSTNLGQTICQLNPANGRLIAEDRGVPPMHGLLDRRALSAQNDRVIVVAGSKLQSIDRVTGKVQWSLALPDNPHWSVRPVGPDRVLAHMTNAAWAWAERVPVTHQWCALIVDAKTGAVVSRCDLPARGPEVMTGTIRGMWVVALPGGVWAFPTNQREAR